MSLTIKIKRATRAQLDSAATSEWLNQSEPYLITDEDRIAVGTSTSTYKAMATQDEIGDIQTILESI
jgi:PHD/YefM family antitoxin component YafN of YafNO toxin-antitoxin module